ncbi:MAG: hypothetical protein MJ170_04260 [Alphaproteobacteria bacterium]|nr:hypothetical protein [Alphaproteobacteria bacterium]
MIKKIALILSCLMPVLCFANDTGVLLNQDDFVTVESIIERAPDDTQCATAVFANALRVSAEFGTISQDAHESDMQAWIYSVFGDKTVLEQVLNCPEIANADDDDFIKFIPIQYDFPNGRQVIINYEVTPTVLKQKLIVSEKRDLPMGPDSADLTAGDAIWTNVDPAWYGIIVVEHGALKDFVGEDKNNTVSLKYIYDNIDKLYPRGMTCTSKSALANDTYAINRAVTQTVGIKEMTGEADSNDYYVAGDVNLGWIMYAEIALDVVITVLTAGGGTVIAGVAKSARASKILKNLSTTIKTLAKTDDVMKYTKNMSRIAKVTRDIEKLDKVKDADKIADLTREMDNLRKVVTDLEKTDNVRDYLKATQSFSDINKLRHELKGLRAFWGPKRGNVFVRLARTFKGARAAMNGAKTLNKGAKIARTGKFATRARDWLFHSTMKNAGRLAKVEAAGGALYGALTLIGGVYDYTETSTGDFTNNIEFKPLLLLSADDIDGQDNVVNYGMWLMWAGDSMSAADDDAAYLQAMDFAAKFHEDLTTEQNETSAPCNVDIFVVRPIIRNPGDMNQELYYLIMNDEPWTTAN